MKRKVLGSVGKVLAFVYYSTVNTDRVLIIVTETQADALHLQCSRAFADAPLEKEDSALSIPIPALVP